MGSTKVGVHRVRRGSSGPGEVFRGGSSGVRRSTRAGGGESARVVCALCPGLRLVAQRGKVQSHWACCHS